MRRLALPGLLALACACSSSTSDSSESAEGTEPEGMEMTQPTGDALADLRAHVEELLELPEKEGVSVVEVQHLLVSFAGTGTEAKRTKEEAETLAADLFARIRAGEDFDGLVKQHTDDSHPGIYTMTTGVPSPGEYRRNGMVAAFGDTGWRLEVGEVGVAGFDQKTSPYGWHIVKRTR